MHRYTRLWAALLFLATVACHRAEPRESGVKSEITVAAAANLTDAVAALGMEFEGQTGIHPVFSFGSTAELTQQIEQAAPFDVFLAADTQHVDSLDSKGLIAKGSRSVYAVGVLALWIPTTSNAKITSVADLAQPAVKTIAVAKPELAPYGAAAVEAMKRTGIWDRAEPKVVYANNISAARQYGTAGNADAVFTAYSLVLNDAGQVIQVDESLHDPLAQAAGILTKSAHPVEARKFLDFLLKGSGRETLKRFGYRSPTS